MADLLSRRRLVEYTAAVITVAIVVTALVVASRPDRPSTPAASATAASTSTRDAVTTTRTTTATATTTVGRPTTSIPGSTTPPRITTSTARPVLPPALVGRQIQYLPGSAAVVALTFDAGANADGVPSILDTLRREGVPATFFLTGAFADRFPGPSTAVAAAGHRLGNHTVDHPHLPALSDAAIRAQLAGAERSIQAATGRGPRPLFRFPFGEHDQRTIATVNAAGYVAIGWTVDSLGWKGTSGGMTADTVTARVLNALRPGAIVLMHVGSNPNDHTTLDAAALPAIIAGIRAAGYGFVTLDALLDGA